MITGTYSLENTIPEMQEWIWVLCGYTHEHRNAFLEPLPRVNALGGSMQGRGPEA